MPFYNLPLASRCVILYTGVTWNHGVLNECCYLSTEPAAADIPLLATRGELKCFGIYLQGALMLFLHDIDGFYAAMEIAQHIAHNRKHLQTGS